MKNYTDRGGELRDADNSSHHTKAEFNNCFIIYSKYFQVLNPLSPKSYQHQISPYNINTFQNRVVMRITDKITQDEFA